MQLNKHPTLNILLADDDYDDRFFFEKALKNIAMPISFKTVPDGERLMEYLAKNVKQLPDILFLDINMPKKTGPECLVEIKANKKLCDIPVIMYSTSLQDAVADKLYTAGAHYYMQKKSFAGLDTRILSVINLLKENPLQPAKEAFLLKIEAAADNADITE